MLDYDLIDRLDAVASYNYMLMLPANFTDMGQLGLFF